jgi:hypothetical protein
LDGKAGDLCITHCDLLHASTYNTSDRYRYFISEYVQAAGLPHRDDMVRETPCLLAPFDT